MAMWMDPSSKERQIYLAGDKALLTGAAWSALGIGLVLAGGLLNPVTDALAAISFQHAIRNYAKGVHPDEFAENEDRILETNGWIRRVLRVVILGRPTNKSIAMPNYPTKIF